MKITIAKKLGTAISILLLALFILGIISYFSARKINENLGSIINNVVPIDKSAFEMEINVIGTGFWLLSYLDTHQPQYLKDMATDIADFNKFQKDYAALADTPEEKELAATIGKAFQEAETLANKLNTQEDEQTRIFRLVLQDFTKIDDILDDKIQVHQASGSRNFDKIEASMELEININEIAKNLGNYLKFHDEIYEERILSDEEDFRRFFKRYRSLNLSQQEENWANEISILFDTNMKRISDIIALKKERVKGIAQFIQLRATIDNLLDENIQVLTDTHLKEAETRSQRAVDQTIFLVVIFTLIGLLIGGAGSYLISRSITLPMKKLTNWATRIASGDLSKDETISAKDEIGDLSESFKRMVLNLREFSMQNVTATQNLNTTAAEILAAIQQQASSTKEQAVALQQTTTTMEEVNQTGSQISERARDVAQTAEAAASSSVAGIQAVNEANSMMEAIKEQVELVAENIVILSEKTQVIGEIISTVNDIAEQSNLLALNAAIEAVGAGEQGQRFSVVANEIKNLADRAKESTVQVRTILSEIQKGINTSVMATEEAVKRVETGKTKSEVAAQTIKQLTDSTQQSVRVFQQIVGGTNQQQIGLEQVTEALKNIRTATEQTAAGINQIEKAVANLNTLSQQLNELVERYRT